MSESEHEYNRLLSHILPEIVYRASHGANVKRVSESVVEAQCLHGTGEPAAAVNVLQKVFRELRQ